MYIHWFLQIEISLTLSIYSPLTMRFHSHEIWMWSLLEGTFESCMKDSMTPNWSQDLFLPLHQQKISSLAAINSGCFCDMQFLFKTKQYCAAFQHTFLLIVLHSWLPSHLPSHLFQCISPSGPFEVNFLLTIKLQIVTTSAHAGIPGMVSPWLKITF